MANTTDFISAVYDELAKHLQLTSTNPSILMQMAWPGYALSPSDFRRDNATSGPYDPEVAKEVFSALANIAPTLSKTRFENSGFEVDDLYEIVLSSAIPVGSTQETVHTNPIYRLFSDAQYEFMQAKRGLHDDPSGFYCPCTATPGNWYDEAAAAGWPTITLKETEVKPADPASPFVKAGGVDLVRRNLWHLKPSVADAPKLASKLRRDFPIPPKAPSPVVSKADAMRSVSPSMLKQLSPLAKTSPKASQPALKNVAPQALDPALAKSRFSQALRPSNVLSRSPLDFARVDVLKRDLGVQRLKDRLLLKQLLEQQAPSKPASPTTDGFSVSFKFCRVNIERPWFKLALLSTPNWWMFGTPAGMYSTGTADNNPGLFPLLTTSFIVIRDLKITANWSQEDRANLGNASSFGFFDVRDGTLNSNTLEVKGLQVIGWVSKLMPMLPPKGEQ